jgi:hypothetical protein
LEWKFVCPKLPPANPFTGAFDFLGTWQINGINIDPAQLIAVIIIMLFLCIGSVYSVEASCILAVIAGGILIVMGWWSASIPMFGLATVTAILIAIEQSKKSLREV